MHLFQVSRPVVPNLCVVAPWGTTEINQGTCKIFVKNLTPYIMYSIVALMVSCGSGLVCQGSHQFKKFGNFCFKHLGSVLVHVYQNT